MIRGIHGLFYSSQSPELRAFLRDKLRLPASDVGEGWLIFDLPEGDLGVHPVDRGGVSGQHEISFYTDDLEATVTELEGRGVVFDGEIEDYGFGFVIHLTMPGGVKVLLYQPKYVKQKAAPKSPTKKALARKPTQKQTAAKAAPRTAQPKGAPKKAKKAAVKATTRKKSAARSMRR